MVENDMDISYRFLSGGGLERWKQTCKFPILIFVYYHLRRYCYEA